MSDQEIMDMYHDVITENLRLKDEVAALKGELGFLESENNNYRAHQSKLPKIKADAVREMLRDFNGFSSGWAKDANENVYWLETLAEEYADKLEGKA